MARKSSTKYHQRRPLDNGADIYYVGEVVDVATKDKVKLYALFDPDGTVLVKQYLNSQRTVLASSCGGYFNRQERPALMKERELKKAAKAFLGDCRDLAAGGKGKNLIFNKLGVDKTIPMEVK